MNFYQETIADGGEHRMAVITFNEKLGPEDITNNFTSFNQSTLLNMLDVDSIENNAKVNACSALHLAHHVSTISINIISV